jgi:hypothetical protein
MDCSPVQRRALLLPKAEICDRSPFRLDFNRDCADLFSCCGASEHHVDAGIGLHSGGVFGLVLLGDVDRASSHHDLLDLARLDVGNDGAQVLPLVIVRGWTEDCEGKDRYGNKNKKVNKGDAFASECHLASGSVTSCLYLYRHRAAKRATFI